MWLNEWLNERLLNVAYSPLFHKQTAWVKPIFSFLSPHKCAEKQRLSIWWMLWKVGLLVLWATRTFHALRLLGTMNAETSAGKWLDGTNAFIFRTKATNLTQLGYVWIYCKSFLAVWMIVFCCLFSLMTAKYLLINKTLQSLPYFLWSRRVFTITSKTRVSIVCLLWLACPYVIFVFVNLEQMLQMVLCSSVYGYSALTFEMNCL